MAGKDGGAVLLFDLVAIREELDVLTRLVADTTGKSVPEARFSALVGMHIRGARAAIPLSREATEERIRTIVEEEIAKAFHESE